MSDLNNIEPVQNPSSQGTDSGTLSNAPLSNVADATPSVTSQPTTTSSSQGNEVIDYRQRYEAIAPKVSTLETERNEFSKKYSEADTRAKQNDATIKALDTVFSKDKAAYDAFRIGYKAQTGTDLPEYEKAYSVATPPVQNNTNNITQPFQPDINSLANQVAQRFKEQQAEESMKVEVRSFLDKHPDYDPVKNTDSEALKQKQFEFNLMSNIAVAIKAYSPELSWDQALENAQATLPETREQIASKAQLQGEKIGRATALSAGSASGKAPTGDSNTTVVQDKSLYNKLTEPQRKRYDEHIRSGNTKFANDYARRAVEGS